MSTTEPSSIEEVERELRIVLHRIQCVDRDGNNAEDWLDELVQSYRATVAKLTEERDAATARVAELEAQVRYDVQLLRQKTASVEEFNSLRAQLAERDAMVAEAKGLLAVAQSTFGGHKSRDWCERRDALLTNTAQAAADYEARIRAPLEAQVAALMSYVRWLDNHGSLEIEADDAETMLERYSVAEIKYKDEQQTRFMQGNTAAAAEAHDAGVRRRATAAVKSVRDEAVKLADHHCVVQVLRWLDRAIAALSTAGKEET